MQEEEAKEQLWTARQAKVTEDRAAERAGLIRLGNFATNHMNKHHDIINEAVKEDDIKNERFASFTMRKDAEQLVVIGELLGEEAGKYFRDIGERKGRLIYGAYNIDIDRDMIKAFVDGWTAHWKARDLITGQGWNRSEEMQEMPVTPELVLMPHSEFTNAKWWDVLMPVLGYDEKANCAFCGEVPATGTNLQICGAQGSLSSQV
ncbi:unnamed protein product [Zymoseptoria tritici ST99CH_1A5]|uniref:Uncharacterized protein n=1 Tax=Zymoseptoria tritici ST99CH_1A5 TaxID=1276529 RepID=A0A1Y6LT74_ZYMTR|nr:unnamed protein product [Zymoseptoria tritici ST99CH_1A5]